MFDDWSTWQLVLTGVFYFFLCMLIGFLATAVPAWVQLWRVKQECRSRVAQANRRFDLSTRDLCKRMSVSLTRRREWERKKIKTTSGT